MHQEVGGNVLSVDRSRPGYMMIKEQLWITFVVATLLGGTALYLCIMAWLNDVDRQEWIGAAGCLVFFVLFVLISRQSSFEFDLTRNEIHRRVRGLLGSTSETFRYGDIRSVTVVLSVELYDTPLRGVVLTTNTGRIVPLSNAFYGIYRKGASPPELQNLIQELLNLQTSGGSTEPRTG